MSWLRILRMWWTMSQIVRRTINPRKRRRYAKFDPRASRKPTIDDHGSAISLRDDEVVVPASEVSFHAETRAENEFPKFALAEEMVEAIDRRAAAPPRHPHVARCTVACGPHPHIFPGLLERPCAHHRTAAAS